MLLWLVIVVCPYRGLHSTLDVVDFRGTAVMLLWLPMGLQGGCSGSQWGCSVAALDPSGAAAGLLWIPVGLQ